MLWNIYKRTMHILCRRLFKLLFRIEMQGDLSAFNQERLLILANHESLMDGVILALFLPVDPVFLVWSGNIGNPVFDFFLNKIDYIGIDPDAPMSIRQVIKVAKSGRPVMIFPEGRMTSTSALMKLYDGPGFVARHADAAVLPVRLHGPGRSFFGRLGSPHPRTPCPKITITAHRPSRVKVPKGENPRQTRRQASRQLLRAMQHMLFATQPSETLFGELLKAVKLHGRKRGVVADQIWQAEHSYGKLLERTLILGRLLERLSQPGENVGVLLPNSMDSLAAIIGLAARGRAAAMLDVQASAETLAQACELAGIKTIVIDKRLREDLENTNKIKELSNISLISPEELLEQFTQDDRKWLAGYKKRLPQDFESAADREAPAVVLFNWRSGGEISGAVYSHQALLASVAQLRAVMDFSMEDRFLNCLPMSGAVGLTAGTLLPVFLGARVFLYPKPDDYRQMPEMAYDRASTVMFATDALLAGYARYAHDYDFYRVRYVAAAIEPLSEEVRRNWYEKFGLRVMDSYGATETTPLLSLNTLLAAKPGTQGQLLPGLEARLAPINGSTRQGEVLEVQGASLMLGHYRCEQPGAMIPLASASGPGWYNTGDRVSLNPDGFIKRHTPQARSRHIASESPAWHARERGSIDSHDTQHASLRAAGGQQEHEHA
jgi:acyl-[acyl-carrier-protein]-phospholipid O-acyltransferase/long-chain-fatty-acid--[acyl-carrier-protein] ligase